MSIETVFSAIKSHLDVGDEDSVSQLLLPYADSVDFSVATHLIRLMTDDVDVEDTMWGFIHMMERCDPKLLDMAIVNEIHNLYQKAPRWAEVLLGRALNSSQSQGRGFDSGDFVQTIRDHGNAECKRLFNQITAGWPDAPKGD